MRRHRVKRPTKALENGLCRRQGDLLFKHDPDDRAKTWRPHPKRRWAKPGNDMCQVCIGGTQNPRRFEQGRLRYRLKLTGSHSWPASEVNGVGGTRSVKPVATYSLDTWWP
jgi:hypothetical protein